jgi:hypothetical protein
MLTPAEQDITAYSTGIFDPVFTLYADSARTAPFDLTGYTVEVDIATPTPLVLAVGSGLTIPTPTNGVVNVKLTPTQTAAVPHPDPQGTQAHYFMKLTLIADTTNVTFPLHGTISFVSP